MVMFDTDWRDPSRYDRVVNPGPMTADETTHMIVETIKLPGCQPTGLSPERLQDIVPAIQVYAILITVDKLMGGLVAAHRHGIESPSQMRPRPSISRSE